LTFAKNGRLHWWGESLATEEEDRSSPMENASFP